MTAETTDASPPPMDHALEAALHLAAERPWGTVTLSDIAAHAGIPLTDLYGVADKDAIAIHGDAYFDRAMSAEGFDPSETPRERLFDVIMLRFEAMEAHRAGLLSLMRARDRAPGLRLKRLAAQRRSAEWALVSAGLDGDTGVPMALRTLGLARVMAHAERAWRRETDPGFARTMSVLDKGLRNGEARLDRLFRRRHRNSGWRSEQQSADPQSPETAPDTESGFSDQAPNPTGPDPAPA